MNLLNKNAFYALLPLLALASLTTTQLQAAPSAEKTTVSAVEHVCQGALSANSPWLDRTHDYLSANVCQAAVWFDRFFSDARDEEENADRFIRLVNELEWDELNGMDLNLRVRARIELPRFKRFGQSMSLILTGENNNDANMVFPQDEAIIESNPSVTGNTQSKRSLGLLWDVKRDPQSAFSIGSSIRLRSQLKPLFDVRYRYTYEVDEQNLIRATQNLFWESDEGFGERTRLDYEVLLQPKTLLRWSASGMYSQKSDGYEWGIGASIFRNLSRKQSVSFDWTITGDTQPKSEVNEYRFGIRYRQNFYRPWLFFEIEPEAFLPLEDDYALNWGIALRLEVQLGRKRDPEQDSAAF